MRIKQIRSISSIGIALVVCVLFLVACNNDNSVGNDPSPTVFAPVTAVELSVDQANFTGTCPHTFKFSGVIMTSAAGKVEYEFRNLYDDIPFIERAVVYFNSAGSRTVSRELVVPKSEEDEVVLLVTGTNSVSSKKLPITATCGGAEPANIAGSWTGDFTVNDPLGECYPIVSLPATANFQQNGSAVVGTLEADGGCGLGYPFEGTIDGNTLRGIIDGALDPPGRAYGTLSRSTLEITTENGYGYVMGTMHLHR